MKTLIVVPTYNERENISSLLEALINLKGSYHILVVDDSSPDGTAEIVTQFSKQHPEIFLLLRKGKEGLGRAYIAGFKWGLEKAYDIIVEMDADFSHRPQDLAPLLSRLKDHDFAVGSRYIPGGQTVNWGWMRKLISRGGSIYSRFILGYPLRDWTGGFNAWKKEVLQGIDLDSVRSNGYSFQIELKYKALRKNFKGAESPIVFEDRRVGQSKMSFRIVVEAFYRVWLLRAK